MKYRKLGRDGPSVSAISHGPRQRSRSGSASRSEQEFNATIRRALELGINFFDSLGRLLGHAA